MKRTEFLDSPRQIAVKVKQLKHESTLVAGEKMAVHENAHIQIG